MSREPRYADLLAFLREGGAALAELSPRSASALAAPTQDPDVERLLEGLAYLSARVEARHAAELPILSDAACELFFPGLLAPVPAVTLAEVSSTRERTLPRSTEILSIPVEETRCRFRTVFSVPTGPARLSQARLDARRGVIELVLQFEEVAFPPESAGYHRLYLGGDFGSAALLHGLLTHSLRKVEWLRRDAKSGAPAPEVRLRAAGLEPEDSLYPEEFSGSPLSLLKEYFAFPQKFLFVDLLGLKPAAERLGLDRGAFGLRLEMASDQTRELRLHPEDLRLGVTPVVNLFEDTTTPLTRRPLDFELELRPEGMLGHQDILAVREVQARTEHRTYEYPLFSALDLDELEEIPRVAQVYRRDGRGLPWRLHLESREPVTENEVLSVSVWGSNGRLPRLLRPGDIAEVRGIDARGLRVKSIAGIAGPFDPPRGEAVRRALISALSLSLQPLTALSPLKSLLELCHFPAHALEEGQRELELLGRALVDVDSELKTVQLEGHSAQAREVVLVVDEQAFGSEGEIYLLGAVLDRVYAMEAGLNVVSMFRVVEQKSGKELRWPKRLGARSLER